MGSQVGCPRMMRNSTNIQKDWSFKETFASRQSRKSGQHSCSCQRGSWSFRKLVNSQTQIKKYHQKSNQPFKLFYSELVTLASLCKFDEGLCDADKQKIIDLFLLNKIIFSIHDRAALKKLFWEKKLNLTKAIKMIEAYEEIQETFASTIMKSMINEEFSSTICRAQVFRDQTQNQRKEKTSDKPPRSLRKQTIGSNIHSVGINMTHTERAPLKESNVTIVAEKAFLKKCASRKISVSHRKARAQLYPTSPRRPNRSESTCTRMQGKSWDTICRSHELQLDPSQPRRPDEAWPETARPQNPY